MQNTVVKSDKSLQDQKNIDRINLQARASIILKEFCASGFYNWRAFLGIVSFYDKSLQQNDIKKFWTLNYNLTDSVCSRIGDVLSKLNEKS